MKLRLLYFGRPARNPLEKVVQEYIQRVGRRWPVEDISLRPDSRGRDANPAAALKREGEMILQKIPKGYRLVALDEHGSEFSSREFADHLRRWETDAVPGLLFVIGSDRGLAPEILEKAALRFSLSRLTLPHRIARLLLWEQLYRAADILEGGRYHRS